jgi:hypothetical protein
LTIEVLSRRTAQQGDLTQKPQIYADCGVSEYALVDPTGQYLGQRLLMRRRQTDGTWLDSQDADGGVTSALGFRIVFDDDGQVRVTNAATGQRYARPHEAQSEYDARRAAERRASELEAEIVRLRALLPPERKD